MKNSARIRVASARCCMVALYLVVTGTLPSCKSYITADSTKAASGKAKSKPTAPAVTVPGFTVLAELVGVAERFSAGTTENFTINVTPSAPGATMTAITSDGGTVVSGPLEACNDALSKGEVCSVGLSIALPHSQMLNLDLTAHLTREGQELTHVANLQRTVYGGIIDQTFAGTGQYTGRLAEVAGNVDDPNVLIVQNDGKILISGATVTIANNDGGFLLRLDSTGLPDSTFNGSGHVLFNYPDAFQTDKSRGAGIRSDGKIITTGYGYTNAGRFDAYQRVFNIDGSLDTTWANGGLAKSQGVALPARLDKANKILVLDSDKYVTAGYVQPTATTYAFAIFKHLANGTLDTSFGGGTGIQVIQVGTGATEEAFSIISQSLGGQRKYLAGGWFKDVVSTTGLDMAITRVSEDGSPDTTFAGTGTFKLALTTGDDTVWDIVAEDDGRVFGCGQSNLNIAFLALDSLGRLDPGFGTNGTLTLGKGTCDQLRLASDKIVFVGNRVNEDTTTTCIVGRMSKSGVLDETFGEQGLLAIPVAGHASSACKSLAFDSSGNVLVSGWSMVSTGVGGVHFVNRIIP